MTSLYIANIATRVATVKQMNEIRDPYGSRHKLISHDFAVLEGLTTVWSEVQLSFASFSQVRVTSASRYNEVVQAFTFHFNVF